MSDCRRQNSGSVPMVMAYIRFMLMALVCLLILKQMLKSDYVFSLLTDSDGNVWVGCLDGDMACFPSDKYNLNGTGKSVVYSTPSTKCNASRNHWISVLLL